MLPVSNKESSPRCWELTALSPACLLLPGCSLGTSDLQHCRGAQTQHCSVLASLQPATFHTHSKTASFVFSFIEYLTHYLFWFSASRKNSPVWFLPGELLSASLMHKNQGGEGRVSEAEKLRSSRQIQSIFNLLGRTGKIIIFIIWVGIWRCNEHGKRKYQQFTGVSGDVMKWSKHRKTEVLIHNF